MSNPENYSRENAVREAGAEIKHRAEDVKEEVGARAGEVKDTITAKAGRAAAQIGEKLEHASERVRERGEAMHMPGAGRAVADSMQRAGNYLQSTGFRALGRDITQAVRRHPVQALLIGAGVGYLVGRMMRR